jgi:hypothetical protein
MGKGRLVELTLAQDVKNTIRYGLGVGSNDISPLGDAPDDGITHPQKDRPGSNDVVIAENVGTHDTSIGATFPRDGEGHEEKCNTAEGEKAWHTSVTVKTPSDLDQLTPLVAAMHKRTNKQHNNHNQLHQQSIQRSRSRHARGQQQLDQDQRISNKPINIPDVENLSHIATDLGISAEELDLDGGPAKIAAHTEVCDGGDQADRDVEVVEQALGAWLEEGEAHKGEGGEGHHSGDGEEPV